jgi:hypothetical protein
MNTSSPIGQCSLAFNLYHHHQREPPIPCRTEDAAYGKTELPLKLESVHQQTLHQHQTRMTPSQMTPPGSSSANTNTQPAIEKWTMGFKMMPSRRKWHKKFHHHPIRKDHGFPPGTSGRIRRMPQCRLQEGRMMPTGVTATGPSMSSRLSPRREIHLQNWEWSAAQGLLYGEINIYPSLLSQYSAYKIFKS